MSPLFSFGVIADIQYADIENAMNFSKTEHRGYRNALKEARRAVEYWKELVPSPLFIAQLGDLIDGQNSGTYGQGTAMESPQSEKAFTAVMNELKKSGIHTVHAVGNHELYNFSWEEMRALYNDEQNTIAKEHFYFSFQPIEGWTCIMLNPYEISIMQPEDSRGYKEAYKILKDRNKNFLTQGTTNFFEGLKGLEQRFVPFNGAFGPEQLLWLEQALDEANKKGERVLIFTHAPIFDDSASTKNLAFDYEQALEIIHRAGNVVLVMAGHYHRGGYAQDEQGVHHITVQSPLIHGHCFGVVRVFDTEIECQGIGEQRSYSLKL